MKDNEKNNNINSSFDDFIKDGINHANNFLVKKGQETIAEYLKNKSPELDKYIVDMENSGVGKYVAGELSLILDGDDCFYLNGDFYFKNTTADWVKKTVKSKSIKIEWAFCPDDQDRLRINKKITFEYNHP